MKKGQCLNSEVSYVISKMGHFDTLTIGDAGLPVPENVRRIDLAVTLGMPPFQSVFDTVMTELKVQRATIASEMREKNPALYASLTAYFQAEKIEVREIPHEAFKRETAASKAVIRTGECNPYANVILESGVTF